MTAVVSRERAARTGLTAAAAALMLAVAFVMMVVAAPGHAPIRVQQAKPSSVRLANDVTVVRAASRSTAPPWVKLAGRAAPAARG